jgi:hypothetical protein
VRPIERLIRGDAWDRETQAAFRAHLRKPMKDDARLAYCERKAWFMFRGGKRAKLRAAARLLDWALEEFPQATARTRGLARSMRAQLREQVGDFDGAAKDSRQSLTDDSTLAVGPLHVARALLRHDRFIAGPEVLALERKVLGDPNAHLLRAYSLWTDIVAACCAQARGDARKASSLAGKALDTVFGDAPAFEAWVRRRKRAAVPDLDLTPAELSWLARTAGRLK